MIRFYIHMYLFFPIFFPYRLLQNIEYHSCIFFFLDNGTFPLNPRSSQLQDRTGVKHLFDQARAFVIFTANIIKPVNDDDEKAVRIRQYFNCKAVLK